MALHEKVFRKEGFIKKVQQFPKQDNFLRKPVARNTINLKRKAKQF